MAEPIDLGGGWWMIRVFVNEDAAGNKVRYRTQRRFKADGIRRAKPEARRIEAEVLAEFLAAQDASAHLTVAQAAEQWWDLFLVRQRSPTTRQAYRAILDNHILRAPFADDRVEDVSTGQVERWYATLAAGGTVREVERTVRQKVTYPGRAKRPTAAQLAATPVGTLREFGASATAVKALRRAGVRTVADAAGVELPGDLQGCQGLLDALALAKRAPERPKWEIVEKTEKVADPPLNPLTIRRIHAVLTQVFDQCVRDRTLVANPAKPARKPEARRARKKFTTVPVVMAIVAAAHRRSAVRSRMIAFAALTGLRRGEMCGLRWGKLDVGRGILMVEFAVVTAQERFIDLGSAVETSKLHVKDPKAHQLAAIALGDQATEIARQQLAWQQEQGAVGETATTDEFDGPAGPYLWAVEKPFLAPMHPDTLTKWFAQAAKDAGVTGVSLHSMRHWQASQVLAVGGTVADVQERLRHESMATSMIYLEADSSKQAALVQLLPRLELPAPTLNS